MSLKLGSVLLSGDFSPTQKMDSMIAGLVITATSGCGILILVVVLACTFFDYRRFSEDSSRRRHDFRLFLSLSCCHGIGLLISAMEIAPSLLVKKLIYGTFVHNMAGCLTMIAHCSSFFHLILLTAIGVTQFDKEESMSHSKKVVQKAVFIFAWLISGSLGIFSATDHCQYKFSIENLVYYCPRDHASFMAIIGFSFVFPLALSIVLVAYGYCKMRSNGRVHDTQNAIISISTGFSYEQSPKSLGPIKVKNLWLKMLCKQLVSLSIKMAAIIIPTIISTERAQWGGLCATLCLIICDFSSLLIYVRFFAKLLHLLHRQQTVDRQKQMEQHMQSLDVSTLQPKNYNSSWTTKLMEFQLAKRHRHSLPIVRIVPPSPQSSFYD